MVIFIYIRIKFQFWALQPVFHLYDLHHWLNPNRIIVETIPKINKYVNLVNIQTYAVRDAPSCLIKEASKLIKTHYLRSKLVEYLPEQEDIFEYFDTNLSTSYISVYTDFQIVNQPEIIGVITARPLFVTFKQKPVIIVNYIDNLTVKKEKRKMGIAPSLIQTHHFHIRRFNMDTKVCLFKREGDMTAIVPLTTYNISSYDLSSVIHITHNLPKTNVIKIEKHNFIIFKEMVKHSYTRFECCINMDLTTLYQLVVKGKIIIYVVMYLDEPVCCYVFKKIPCVVEIDKKCIELISTLACCPYNDVFLTGFQSACRRIVRKYKISRVIIEEIGDTRTLINSLNVHKIYPKSQCPSAFFLYNYACYSIKPEKCFLIY
jgi:hypothetical protein